MSADPQTRLLLVTVPAETGDGVHSSRNLVRSIVTEGFAACVNRIPSVISTYLWENDLHEDDEEVLLIKTSQRKVKKLIARIEELHPYDLPEILVIDVADGLPAYLNWVEQQCSRK